MHYGEEDSDMRRSGIPVCLAGITVASAALAAEISHTSYTWFCHADRLAHGMCTTRHTDCGKDCVSLNKVCSVDREGRLMREDRNTVNDVGTSGTFRSVVDVALYGTGSINYCTRNKSKYANWAGKELLFQGTSTYCREYSRAAARGDEEH